MIQQCWTCNEFKETVDALDTKSMNLGTFCKDCLCEDCGHPLYSKPDPNKVQTRFCNSTCYAKLKGLQFLGN